MDTLKASDVEMILHRVLSALADDLSQMADEAANRAATLDRKGYLIETSSELSRGNAVMDVAKILRKHAALAKGKADMIDRADGIGFGGGVAAGAVCRG